MQRISFCVSCNRKKLSRGEKGQVNVEVYSNQTDCLRLTTSHTLGYCPSLRQNLDGVSENVNALLKESFATLRAQDGTTTLTGKSIHLNSSLTSTCEILPALPAKFYCMVQGGGIPFQVDYTIWLDTIDALPFMLFLKKMQVQRKLDMSIVD